MTNNRTGLFWSLCVLWMVFVLSASIALPILFRPFYYAHIRPLHLPEESGYTDVEIREAYDQMMDFCVYGKGEFGTGVMPFSEEGKAHFEDCRGLFLLDFILAGGSFALLGTAALIQHRKKSRVFRYGHTPQYFAAWFLGILFAVIGILCSVGFDAAFVTFHKIFFPGKSNWLFDWNEDQIIRVLPEQFFLNAAILIGVSVIAGILLLILWDRKTVKTKKRENTGTARI